jgi:uncharacterized protein (DUF2147 family)
MRTGCPEFHRRESFHETAELYIRGRAEGGMPMGSRRWLLLPLLAAGLMMHGTQAQPQPNVTGPWLVADKRAIIEIYPCGPDMCGRIAWMDEPLRPDGSVKRDEHNSDPALRSRTICGLPIMTGFKPAGPGEWEEGRIYDPTDGSTWHAEMRLDHANTLRLRGYVLLPLLGQSQIWTRVSGNFQPCAPG